MPNPPGGSACASRSDGTFDPGADRPPSGGPLQAGPVDPIAASTGNPFRAYWVTTHAECIAQDSGQTKPTSEITRNMGRRADPDTRTLRGGRPPSEAGGNGVGSSS